MRLRNRVPARDGRPGVAKTAAAALLLGLCLLNSAFAVEKKDLVGMWEGTIIPDPTTNEQLPMTFELWDDPDSKDPNVLRGYVVGASYTLTFGSIKLKGDNLELFIQKAGSEEPGETGLIPEIPFLKGKAVGKEELQLELVPDPNSNMKPTGKLNKFTRKPHADTLKLTAEQVSGNYEGVLHDIFAAKNPSETRPVSLSLEVTAGRAGGTIKLKDATYTITRIQRSGDHFVINWAIHGTVVDAVMIGRFKADGEFEGSFNSDKGQAHIRLKKTK